jgi:hypothetical protein
VNWIWYCFVFLVLFMCCVHGRSFMWGVIQIQLIWELRRSDWQIVTKVSEEHSTSILGQAHQESLLVDWLTIKMEALCSSEMSGTSGFSTQHDITIQKTWIFISFVVRTSNVIEYYSIIIWQSEVPILCGLLSLSISQYIRAKNKQQVIFKLRSWNILL